MRKYRLPKRLLKIQVSIPRLDKAYAWRKSAAQTYGGGGCTQIYMIEIRRPKYLWI
ncbi:MAG: hypothetical protein HY399_08565 [Elusimicrobia bacterium]|nr:hypothetical protein [Elusimicrobiota bacterium]